MHIHMCVYVHVVFSPLIKAGKRSLYKSKSASLALVTWGASDAKASWVGSAERST